MMIRSSKCRPRNSAVRFWLTLHATRSAYGRFATDPFYSFLAVLLWAVWAIIPKATSDKMSPALMQVILTIGLVPVASTLAFSKNITAGNRIRRGIVYAFATGLCGCIGN